jgi:hypothetical protein
MRRILLTVVLVVFLAVSSIWATVLPMTPEQAAEQYFAIIQSGDIELISRLMTLDDDLELEEDPELWEYMKFVNLIFSRVSHEFGELELVNDDAAVLETWINAPDMSWVFTQAINEILPLAFMQAMSGEEFTEEQLQILLMENMEKYMQDPLLPFISTQVYIQMVRYDDEWQIISDDALMDALTGNLDSGEEE